MQIIDTFFALDFDRCLGDYEASVDLTKQLIDEITSLDGRTFRKLHDQSTAIKKTFHVMEYLRENEPDIDLNAFHAAYVERARKDSSALLEPWADEFLKFLNEAGHHHCIVSYGDKGWQIAKINGAGLDNVVKVIVTNEFKGQYIAEWFDETSGHFIVPAECFVDGTAKKAREVVLMDDKAKAFKGLHRKARGYLLQDISRLYASPKLKVPSSVKRVNRLDQIIEHESKLANNSKNIA